MPGESGSDTTPPFSLRAPPTPATATATSKEMKETKHKT